MLPLNVSLFSVIENCGVISIILKDDSAVFEWSLNNPFLPQDRPPLAIAMLADLNQNKSTFGAIWLWSKWKSLKSVWMSGLPGNATTVRPPCFSPALTTRSSYTDMRRMAFAGLCDCWSLQSQGCCPSTSVGVAKIFSPHSPASISLTAGAYTHN